MGRCGAGRDRVSTTTTRFFGRIANRTSIRLDRVNGRGRTGSTQATSSPPSHVARRPWSGSVAGPSIRPSGLAYYAQNADRRSMALGGLEQELPHHSRLRLAGTMTPVTSQLSSTRLTLTATERSRRANGYRQGAYCEISLDLEYRTRLDNRRRRVRSAPTLNSAVTVRRT
jgi:hypothetical protein